MNRADERKARLAAELRANLHRRKAQARAAADGAGDLASGDATDGDPGSGPEDDRSGDQPVR